MYRIIFPFVLMMIACDHRSETDSQIFDSGFEIKFKPTDFSGIWDLSIQSFSHEDCRKLGHFYQGPNGIATTEDTKILCDGAEKYFPRGDAIITDHHNNTVSIGLDDSCVGKNFEGHLRSNCKDFVFFGDGIIFDDFKLTATNSFVGTRRAVYINEHVVYEITANVIGTKK